MMEGRLEVLDTMFLCADGRFKSVDDMDPEEGGEFLTLVGTPLSYVGWVYGNTSSHNVKAVRLAPLMEAFVRRVRAEARGAANDALVAHADELLRQLDKREW